MSDLYLTCTRCNAHQPLQACLTEDSEKRTCPICETPIKWWQFDEAHVPSSSEMLDYVRHEYTETMNELRAAYATIEFGDIPDATREVVGDLHSEINIRHRDPKEVIDELFREYGFEALRSVA